MPRFLSKAVTVLGAALLAFALASCEAPSGDSSSDLTGTYKTEDTQGKPMSVTLNEDGSASGERDGETLSGSWKDDGGAAVITWGDDWTTKIAKKGDGYEKSTWEGAMEGDPTHTATAEKVQ